MRHISSVLGALTLGLFMVGSGAAVAQTSPAPAASPAPKNESKAQEHKESSATQSKEVRHASANRNLRYVRGEVTAVETSASPETLTMTTGSGEKAQTIGVDVPSSTKITEGKRSKSLNDIKVGEHVALRYERQSDRLVAQQIHILQNDHTATTSTHPAMPASTPKKG